MMKITMWMWRGDTRAVVNRVVKGPLLPVNTHIRVDNVWYTIIDILVIDALGQETEAFVEVSLYICNMRFLNETVTDLRSK